MRNKNQNVYTVGQVNSYIKNIFDQDYMLRRIYVSGEVSNCKYHPSGHIYFSLKDAEGTISCVMFAGSRRGLAFPMRDGDNVIVGGSISVYERDGKYQIYAKEITKEGAGLLYEKYLALKAELEEMKASYEQQSYDLQCQIDQKKSESADYENEIAYAQQQATEYANLLAEQTAEIQRLEAERIAAEEEARRQAEEEAARQAAEEEAAAKAAEQEQDSESEDEENIEYDEDGNEIENTDDADDESEADDGVEYDENGDSVDNAGASDDVEYDEYGNVIDSDNTVSPDDYESEQSSDSDSSSSSGSGSGSSVVDFATQFVGNPYVWGGTSLTGGADCSGFTQSVYANFGVSLPRTSYEQQNAGTEVSYADAQPGDLICYGGHVAIYMGNGRIVHASNSVDGIKISDNAAYRTIVSVRRLV